MEVEVMPNDQGYMCDSTIYRLCPLHAAAPALLAALEDLHRVVRARVPKSMSDVDAALITARAAIALAKGKDK
jgi:hypothetical protein